MAVVLRMHDKEFLAMVKRQLDAFLQAATLELHLRARKNASVPNRGVPLSKKKLVKQAREQLGRRSKGLIRAKAFDRKTKRDVTAWYWYDQSVIDDTKRQVTIYPFPSKPGESPRIRTGIGHKNIVQGYSSQQQVGRVGYTRNARYMTFHELGIRYKKGIQQRPTIVPAIRESQRRMMIAGRNAARAVQ